MAGSLKALQARHNQAVFTTLIALSAMALRQSENPCVVPVPSNENRASSAGWLRGGDWLKQHQDINQIGRTRKLDLVFLGDSISQGWGGEGRHVWQAAPEVWKQYYEDRNACSFGISGDGTQHLLWRIDHGNFDKARPRVIVLLIGVNNVPSCTPEQVAEGIQAVLKRLAAKTPESKVLLLGLFPYGQKPEAPTRKKVDAVNALISKFEDGKRVFYQDIGRVFLLSSGEANPELMARDFLHLKPEGYRAWAKAIEYLLSQLLRDKARSS